MRTTIRVIARFVEQGMHARPAPLSRLEPSTHALPRRLGARCLPVVALGVSALLAACVDPELATSTRSAADEEDCSNVDVCDPPPAGGGYVPPYPGFATLPSGRSYESCMSPSGVSGDNDHDGVDDTCEQELAYAFRPRLLFNSDDPYGAREPYYALRAANNYGASSVEVKIFYALSYYYDGGFRTTLCAPFLGCVNSSHTGDSEYIVVTVKPDPQITNRWHVASVTLSRHGGADTYSGTDIEYRTGEYLVRPKVYVSWGKHGNYRTTGACGSGAAQLDDCSRAVDSGEEVAVFAGNNLGSRSAAMLDCVASRGWFGYIKPGVECYWTPLTFSGWSAGFGGFRDGQATDYSTQLLMYGF